MTQPFKSQVGEKENIEIKVASEAISEAAPETTAEITSNPTPETLTDEAAPDGPPTDLPTAPEPPKAAPPLKRAKAKRQYNTPLFIGLMSIIATLPLITLGVFTVVDPEVMPFLKSKAFRVHPQEAIADLTDAYHAHNNVDILDDRQRAFLWAGDPTSAEIDRRIMVQANVKNGKVYRQLATQIFEDTFMPATTIDLLGKSAQYSMEHCDLVPIDLNFDSFTLFDSTYDLLSLGQTQTAMDVTAGPAKHHLKGEEISFLKALVMRESGHSEAAAYLLQSNNGSKMRRAQMAATARYFQVLCDLDLHDTAKAEQNWKSAQKIVRQNDWMRDLTKGWIDYQKGDLEQALKNSEKASKELRHAGSTVANKQARHAVFILQSLALSRLGRYDSDARKEFYDSENKNLKDDSTAAYGPRAEQNREMSDWADQLHNAFVPKPYRVSTKNFPSTE